MFTLQDSLLLVLATVGVAFAAAPLSISGPNAFGAATTSIAAGNFHTCAIKSDGTLSCWGDDHYNNVVPSGTFVQVAAKGNQTCAIRTNNTTVCWGYSGSGATSPGTATAGRALMQLSVGGTSGCALGLNGIVTCWGSNTYGNTRPPVIGQLPGTPILFRQIASGYTHVCGIKFDGTIACWGGDAQHVAAGLITPPGGTFREIAAGDSFTCAIAGDGSLRCWGDNIGAPPAGAFRQLAAGSGHACAIRDNGTVACWGATQNFGQISPPGGRFLQLAAGYLHTCGIAENGAVQCWGSNNDYQLYPGQSTPTYNQSRPPGGVFRHAAVTGGNAHSCLITSAGLLRCFGTSTGDASTPPAGNYLQLSAGFYNTCAVSTGGGVACWGYDMPAPAGLFTQVATGFDTACGIRVDGSIGCVRQAVVGGSADDGQAIPPSGRFLQIGAKGTTFCAVRVEGTPVCWGTDTILTTRDGVGICTQASGAGSAPFLQISGGITNSAGLLPNGSDVFVAPWGCGEMTRSTPPPYTGNFSQFAMGFAFGCALRVDGTPACWGDSRDGKLSPPVGTFTQVSAGLSHACAVNTAGAVQCWGWNGFGQTVPPNGGLQSPPPARSCPNLTGNFAVASYNPHTYYDASPDHSEGPFQFAFQVRTEGAEHSLNFSLQRAGSSAAERVVLSSSELHGVSVTDGAVKIFLTGSGKWGDLSLSGTGVQVDLQGNTTDSPNSIQVRAFDDDGNLIADSGTFFLPAGTIAVRSQCVPESGVVNTASLAGDGRVSPGSIATLFGEALADAAAQNSSLPMKTTLGGVQLLVNGRFAPLFSVAPDRITFQVPFETLPGLAEISVLSKTETNYAGTMEVTPSAPGIFLADEFGQATIRNQDASANSSLHPAAPGSTISLYLTGLGLTSPQLISGFPGSGGDGVNRTLDLPAVLIGGQVAEVLFSGAAPGYVGLYQITVRVPAGVGAGGAVPVQVVSGGASGNFATIAVR